MGFESLTLRMSIECFYVYILRSLKDGSFYVGQCDDLDRRMSKHFDGMSCYTSSKRPLVLVYFEPMISRKEALIREKEIKKKKSRKYIEYLIANRFQ
jgi:putative endonuclease